MRMSRNFKHFKLKNLLSALPAIDTVSIDHPSDLKVCVLHGTNMILN